MQRQNGVHAPPVPLPRLQDQDVLDAALLQPPRTSQPGCARTDNDDGMV